MQSTISGAVLEPGEALTVMKSLSEKADLGKHCHVDVDLIQSTIEVRKCLLGTE
jgi:hypothetical protein